MRENEIARIVVDTSIMIHRRLGPGLLETVYEAVLAYELRKHGLRVDVQQAVPVRWEEVVLELGFRADIVVEDLVVLELKAVESLAKVHSRQLLTYLKLMHKRLGLLINFGSPLVKDGIERIVNGLEE